ncbi:prepilin peptidase [Aestuariimicrobium soli]|uniref:prepilin peptidase n=1 Tax=Aestuariimicrobium soli TaxID=2035834 RepID=UPI003EB82B07
MTEGTPVAAVPRWVYLVTALVVLVWAALVLNDMWALPAFAVLAWAWGAGVATDLVRHDLPDRFTLLPYPLVLVALLLPAAAHGEWRRWLAALVTGLVTAVVLFVIAFINPSGFGLGDVKLGLTTGTALGWVGGLTAGAVVHGLRMGLVGIFVAFALFAVVGVVLLVARRAGRTTDVAFGPFMVAGVLLAPAAAALLGW